MARGDTAHRPQRDRASHARELGQNLILFALMAVPLVLMVALTVDLGRAYAEKRLAQNLADSGSTAASTVIGKHLTCGDCLDGDAVVDAICDVASRSSGSYGLSGPCGGPGVAGEATLTLSLEYVDGNGLSLGSVSRGAAIPPSARGVRVAPSKTIPTYFAQVAGLSTLSASARGAAVSDVVTSFNSSQPDLAPYAVWGGEPQDPCGFGCLCEGATVYYRDNHWDDDNISPNNGNWTVHSSDFKGFLRIDAPIVGTDPPYDVVTSGGNAIGQEPIQMLHEHYLAGRPVIMVIIDRGSGGGSHIDLHVAGFVAVRLTNDPLHLPSSTPFEGQIVSLSVLSGGTTGGSPPQAGLPVVRTTKMIQ